MTHKGVVYRKCLQTADADKAKAAFADIRAAILNGTYTATPAPATTERPTFATVAQGYADDAEGLAKLSDSKKREHRYAVAFLATVTVSPGVPFTDKPFADIIRADIKAALQAKATPSEGTFSKGAKTWTRMVGGKQAANRLHDHLRAHAIAGSAR